MQTTIPHYIISTSRPTMPCFYQETYHKTIEISHIFNTFHMHDQQGTFNGIYTCTIKITFNLTYVTNYYMKERAGQ